MSDYLDGFIGQQELRKQVNFAVDGYKATKFLDNTLFIAKRGDGKTTVSRKVGENLGKKFLEINGSSIKSISSFVDQVIIPFVSNNQEICMFIDEVACVNPKVQEWMLSMLQYDPQTKRSTAMHDGVKHDFNFTKLSCVAATTSPQLLSNAFKSRFNRLEFSDYTQGDLVEILHKYSPDVQYSDNIEPNIVEASRGSPREISLRLTNFIYQYLSQRKTDNSFGAKDWDLLRKTLTIRPLGLSAHEEKLLRTLSKSQKTVTNLTGVFNLDMSTIRKEIELYPVSLELVSIGQKRQITNKGIAILKEIDTLKKDTLGKS